AVRSQVAARPRQGVAPVGPAQAAPRPRPRALGARGRRTAATAGAGAPGSSTGAMQGAGAVVSGLAAVVEAPKPWAAAAVAATAAARPATGWKAVPAVRRSSP